MITPRTTTLRIAGWAAAGVLAVGAATGAGVALAGTSGGAPTGDAAAEATALTSDPDRTSDRTSDRASTSDRSAQAAPERGQWHPGRWARLAARRVLHGEFVVADRGDKLVTVAVQRGEVTAVSASSIGLKSKDGYAASYAVNDDTRVRVDGDKAEISDVKTGDQAWLVARKSGDTATAILLVERS
jgi:hypothetical protein